MIRISVPGVIPLTQGFVTVVDEQDYSLATSYKWYPRQHSKRDLLYACKRDGVALHRLLLGFPDSKVDHANRNGLDNRRSNLHLATDSQNCANASVRRNRLYKGISYREGKHRPWQARIGEEGKSLGYYQTAQEAALAYDIAAIERWGEFACTNFPADWFVTYERTASELRGLIRSVPTLGRDGRVGGD